MTQMEDSPEKPAIRRRGNRGRTPLGNPNPIDQHVGTRVRLRRTLMGLSQDKLADALGLTFQQVQKYERGANRVGASRLYDLSRVLDVPVGFFFDDMPDEIKNQTPSMLMSGELEESSAEFEHDPLSKRETLELVRAYYRITDSTIRRRIYELAKSLGDAKIESPDTNG